MPTITPDQFIAEEAPAEISSEPNRTLWISEAGELTQFGAFIEVLQPGSRSSIKHWRSTEDELVYVLEGEITVIEGKLLLGWVQVLLLHLKQVSRSVTILRIAAAQQLAVSLSGLVHQSTESRILNIIGFASETARCLMMSGLTWQATQHKVCMISSSGGQRTTPNMAFKRDGRYRAHPLALRSLGINPDPIRIDQS